MCITLANSAVIFICCVINVYQWKRRKRLVKIRAEFARTNDTEMAPFPVGVI